LPGCVCGAAGSLLSPKLARPADAQAATRVAATRTWFAQAGPTTTKPVAINWPKARTFANWLVAPLADTTNPFAAEHKRAYRYLVVQNIDDHAFTGRIVEVVLEGKAPAAGSVAEAVVTATKRLLVAPQDPAPLPGLTGLLLFYSPAYHYENGFVYEQGVAQNQRVHLLRPQQTKHKAAQASARSIDNESDCIMELRCGYVNGDLSNCIYVAHCVAGSGGGGEGGWSGDSGGSSGGPTTPTPVPTPTTPCGTLTRDGQNPQVQAKFNELKALVTDNKEHGVGISYDAAGNPIFAPVVGQPGVLGIDIATITGTMTSFTHTHYSDTRSLSIFSPFDLQAMGAFYAGGHMENPSTFTMNVITASGTAYSLAISDISAFAAFYHKTLEDPITLATFDDMYGRLYHIDPSNTVAQNEKAFLQMLTQANIGLTLYKGDANNFASWQKLSYINNTNNSSSSPCN
jgi:hypothetical protein